MKRLVRVLIVVLLVLAALAGTILLSVFLLPETDLIRNRVQKELERHTGHEVLLGSLQVRPAFPGLLRLTVAGLSVQTKAGRQLFSADRIILLPAALSLLRGRLDVDSIKVEQFKLQVIREPGGKMGGAVVQSRGLPAAAGLPEITSIQIKPRNADLPVRAEDASTSGNGDTERLKWSIKKITFEGGSVDWIDEEVKLGEKLVVSLVGIRGALKQSSPKEPIAVDLTGDLVVAGHPGSPVVVAGSVSTERDYADIDKLQVKLTAKSISAASFQAYLPPGPPADAAKNFECPEAVLDMTWDKPNPPRITLKADLKGRSEDRSKVNIEAEIFPRQDFSGPEQIRYRLETDILALKSVAPLLPEHFPLEKGTGILRAVIHGVWIDQSNWTAQGTMNVEDGVPKGNLRALGKTARVAAQFKLSPNELRIDGLDISHSRKLASIKGKIDKPLSDEPSLNLEGQIICDSICMWALGVNLPKDLTISGSIPIAVRVTGKPRDLSLDMTGDMTPVGVSWTPFIEKGPGQKGSLSVKGKLVMEKGGKSRPPQFNGLARADMVGVRLRPVERSPWLNAAQVRFEGRVGATDGRADLSDIRLSVRVGAETQDLLAAGGTVTGLGTANPRIDVTAQLNFDSRLLQHSGTEIPAGLIIMGTAPMRAVLKGSSSLLNWWLKLPLIHLDIKMKDSFNKPAGVKGELNVSGQWSEKELSIKTADLTLPGLALRGHGTLKAPDRNSPRMTVELESAKLQEVSRYFPNTAHLGLSGSVAGTVTLEQAEHGIKPTALLRLADVAVQPDKSIWRVGAIKGTAKLDGDSVIISEVTGKMGGFVQGPFSLKGELNKVASVNTMQGRLSLKMKEVRLKEGPLTRVLKQTQELVGTLLDPRILANAEDAANFDEVSGDFNVGEGTAKTDNLAFKGRGSGIGAIGALNLGSSEADMLVGIRSRIIPTDALDKIPGVKDFVKKHKDFFKATGLDKELKRLGVTLPENGQAQDRPSEAPRAPAPATVFLKVQGPAKDPKVTPILEASLDGQTASRLKSLMRPPAGGDESAHPKQPER